MNEHAPRLSHLETAKQWVGGAILLAVVLGVFFGIPFALIWFGLSALGFNAYSETHKIEITGGLVVVCLAMLWYAEHTFIERKFADQQAKLDRVDASVKQAVQLLEGIDYKLSQSHDNPYES